MLRTVVCKGDLTTHGGTVIEGDETSTCNGRPIAIKGCMTFCPKCGGNFPITEGAEFHTFAGLGTVLDGMKTGCGAQVIASPDTTMTVDDGTDGESALAELAPGSEDTPAESRNFATRFQIVDEQTGKPIPRIAYRIILPDGTTLHGTSDDDGNTERITGHDPATVALQWDIDEPTGSN